MKEKIESEYQFKKNLIEYLPLLDNLPIAGCIWRRTGEIERFNPQFEELVDLKYYLQDHQSSSTHRFQQQQELIDDDVGNYDHQQGFCCSDKRVGGRSRLEGFKIYELWDEDSNLNYWEKFNKIALDPGQKAVLTSCVLLRKDIKRLRRRTNRRRQVKGENCEGISELKRIESEIKALDNNSKTKEGGEEEREDVEGGGFDDGRGSENVEFVNCTFSFTIKRDLFGLPCLIIGNFLS
ncbi:expressed protein [Phakopsora pachyrhizi]|uniref:Expressed protein n=1 Tax=Phakopsora pachyrhizi TaxID=170000 RepID=A0AAV0ADT5_PHAPC|nr:expressed protein [Phakopsora pachyrhizi]CAH7666195.1 expressed protein [Phakopsora pachyrhizi]